MIEHGPRPLEILGGLLVLTGLLAYLLIDAEDPEWGKDCRGLDCPEVQPLQRPITVQGLFVVVGCLGLGLMLWGFIQRQRDESP